MSICIYLYIDLDLDIDITIIVIFIIIIKTRMIVKIRVTYMTSLYWRVFSSRHAGCMQGAGLGDQEHTSAGETEKDARPTGADQQLWHREKKKNPICSPTAKVLTTLKIDVLLDIRFSQS